MIGLPADIARDPDVVQSLLTAYTGCHARVGGRKGAALLAMAAGAHPRTVADCLGVHRSTVYSWAYRAAGRKPTRCRPRYSAETVADAVQRVRDGASYSAVGRQMGLQWQTVRVWCLAAGTPSRWRVGYNSKPQEAR